MNNLKTLLKKLITKFKRSEPMGNSKLEEALVLPLHEKVIKFLYHTTRKQYFFNVNNGDNHKISEREVDMLMKGLEIIKLKMQETGIGLFQPTKRT